MLNKTICGHLHNINISEIHVNVCFSRHISKIINQTDCNCNEWSILSRTSLCNIWYKYYSKCKSYKSSIRSNILTHFSPTIPYIISYFNILCTQYIGITFFDIYSPITVWNSGKAPWICSCYESLLHFCFYSEQHFQECEEQIFSISSSWLSMVADSWEEALASLHCLIRMPGNLVT